jgi:hypothetical protein
MKILKIQFTAVSFLTLLLVLSACGKSNTSPGGSGNGGNNTTFAQSTGPCDPDAADFASGDGTVSNPYTILTFCHFYAFATTTSYWNSYVSLGNDLDFSNQSINPMIALTGTFDGGGHTIANYTGASALFATNTGTIKNLNVRNFNVTGIGAVRAAAIVGTNLAAGTVNNCSATGSVTHTSAYFVGGIAGVNQGTISHCWANVNASALNGVGGLVGHNAGTITTSYSLGIVGATASGVNTAGVGGLVGTNASGSINNCFSQATVQGTSSVGGLVGLNQAPVTNSFSAGAVAGTGTNIGGLIGQNTGAVSSAYWDTNTSGQAASAGGTGQTTAALRNQATFAGWDFTTIWTSPTSISYPGIR